jgi:hypothetical protein
MVYCTEIKMLINSDKMNLKDIKAILEKESIVITTEVNNHLNCFEAFTKVYIHNDGVEIIYVHPKFNMRKRLYIKSDSICNYEFSICGI